MAGNVVREVSTGKYYACLKCSGPMVSIHRLQCDHFVCQTCAEPDTASHDNDRAVECPSHRCTAAPTRFKDIRAHATVGQFVEYSTAPSAAPAQDDVDAVPIQEPSRPKGGEFLQPLPYDLLGKKRRHRVASADSDYSSVASEDLTEAGNISRGHKAMRREPSPLAATTKDADGNKQKKAHNAPDGSATKEGLETTVIPDPQQDTEETSLAAATAGDVSVSAST